MAAEPPLGFANEGHGDDENGIGVEEAAMATSGSVIEGKSPPE